MITLKIRYSYILVLIVVGAFFLAPIMSVSGVGAEEQSNLREFMYVEVASEDIFYEKVYGTDMVKNGSKVSIEIVLTGFSKEIEGDESELFFHSDLGVLPTITVDGSPREYETSFVVNHEEDEEVRVTLVGDAPEVNKQKENVTLLEITHKIKEEYPLICIKRSVSSEIIKDAGKAWYEAKEDIEKASGIIANATKEGIKVDEAELNLKLANECLNNSMECYSRGEPEKALEEANLASDFAKVAEEKARTAMGLTTYKTYTILVAVVVIAIVAFVFLIGQRRRRRGIY